MDDITKTHATHSGSTDSAKYQNLHLRDRKQPRARAITKRRKMHPRSGSPGLFVAHAFICTPAILLNPICRIPPPHKKYARDS